MRFLIFASVFAVVSCINERRFEDPLKLRENLEGSWKAEAFGGVLVEEWKLIEGGIMQQESFLMQDEDTTYMAVSQIEKIGGEIILFSVIKNSTPKIFQSISYENNELLFENKDYRNPFSVLYKFLEENRYQRIITGYEGDSLEIYTFEFHRIE